MEIKLYSHDLIEDLNKCYPEKCPDVLDTERMIWMYAGKRELVKTLVALKKRDELIKYNPER
jgi:hypothetical protein